MFKVHHNEFHLVSITYDSFLDETEFYGTIQEIESHVIKIMESHNFNDAYVWNYDHSILIMTIDRTE